MSNNRSTNGSCMSMADQIHAEVRAMIGQSRLKRNSQGIALVHRNDLHVKELLGKGAFSEVHDVTIVNRSTSNNFGMDGNNSSSCGSESPPSYAMKHIKERLLSQAENFRLAAAELALEAHMLASFDHPNIMKIRGWAANGVASFVDGRHDSFFLLLDKLDETLDNRITTWIKMYEHDQMQLHQLEQQLTQEQGGRSGGGGTNIVSDLWRRFSPNQELNSTFPTISTISTNSANLAATSFTPSSPFQRGQQIQQQLQDQQQSPTMGAYQQFQNQKRHRNESLLLEKFGICVEIASALAYLHDKGVIFRDLKPNNIGFLNGRVQLFDFGLSRELPSMNLVEPFEMSGKVGTLRYMAVEVACHSEYNVSADVYSWAMVCYEIFTLCKPFAGWTRDMHSNLVCQRGVRPEFTPTSATDPSLGGAQQHPPPQPVPTPVKQLLEISWHQQAYRRPTMRTAEQRMKQLEEQQLFTVCALDRSKGTGKASHSFNVKMMSNTSGVPSPIIGSSSRSGQSFSNHHLQQKQVHHHMQQQHPQQSQAPHSRPFHPSAYTPHHPHQGSHSHHSQLHHQQQKELLFQHHHQFNPPHGSINTSASPMSCDAVVELPHDFSVSVRKTPQRNHSETYCTSATTMSNLSSEKDSSDFIMYNA